MIRLQLSELAAALGCDAPEHDVAVDAISTDSRKVNFGTLFAALPGSRTDGHDFAPAAVKLGATALLVRRRLDLDVPQLVVEDVLLALGTLAALVRDRLDPVVVGITGSNGKTTVKEMVASILKLKGEVLATQGNYNNELGVPLSIFGLQPKHRFAVLELGASKSGDIAYLSRIARPDVALVNNVGPAHLGGFGSLEGVARAKGEIYAGLPADGWAVLNADEPWLDLWRGVNTAGHSLTFGKAEASDVQVLESPEAARFRTPEGTFEARLALPGRHNHFNAAAAVAIALALGVDIDTIREGLEAV
ncbi:MAG: UDP-N-acetylmuramoyl-tripeptide--D-alanyl-D-alanine ligase, partial [Lysobacterales bacterium]